MKTLHPAVVEVFYRDPFIHAAKTEDNLSLRFDPDEPRDDAGKWTQVAGETDPEKQKFVGAKVGAEVHAHAEKTKHRVARVIGGVPEEDTDDAGQRDKKPYDVRLDAPDGSIHDVEVKTMTVGSKQSISVHEDALMRKVRRSRDAGSTFHTIVYDDRKTYDSGSNSENFSGNRIYYKRGSGRYSLSQMHPVKSESELRDLILAPTRELPIAARGSLPPPPPVSKLRAAAMHATEARRARDKKRKGRL